MPTEPLTARRLNRATLDRQMLSRRHEVGVADAVRRIFAVQAQQPASPYLALWNRVAGFAAADLDAAYADRGVVRATLLRVTLHVVHAEDWPALHAAVLPRLRAARLPTERAARAGLSAEDADAMMADLLDFLADPRAGTEIEAMLAARVAEPKWMWWALRTFAPLHYVPTGGPWSFRHPAAFVAAPPGPAHPDAVDAVIRGYLAAFGPATAADIAQCTRLLAGVVRTGLRGDLIQMIGPRGETLYDLPDATLPPENTPAPPRLLPMWDNVLLAYADRGRVLPDAYRPVVIRRNGDVLPTLLVDGAVAGVWRATEDGIEATAFHPLCDETWQALATEARALCAFLADREPLVYRRYRHWWDRVGLPAAEVRVLPAS